MKNTSVRFTMTGLSTDQFATIDEAKGEDININISISVKGDFDNGAIGLGLSVKFNSAGESFMIINVTCHFKIDDDCWSELSKQNKSDVLLPKEFIEHIATITLGATRGILHAKTENTSFNKYFIPLIDVSKLGGSDLRIERKSEK